MGDLGPSSGSAVALSDDKTTAALDDHRWKNEEKFLLMG